MNRQIRNLGIALMCCYLALFVKLNLLQVVDAPALNARPDNSRKIVRDFNQPRGDIVTADGKVIAHSEEARGLYAFQRTYPMSDLFAHVTGTFTFNFGSDGVERQYSDELSGHTAAFQLRGLTNPFVDTANVGTVQLTLRADVQQAAKDALGKRKGSVVVTDPRSGAILAMWSYPSYEPNLVAINDPKNAAAFRNALLADPDKPLLSQAYRERFFPGSTFKVVTASAGLESGKVTEAAPLYVRASGYTPPLTTRSISNFGGEVCGGTLFELLKVSCNSGFAEMGSRTLGPEIMVKEAEDFGFNAAPPIDLPQPAKSIFPTDFGKRLRAGAAPGDADIFENTPLLAQNSIGQGDVSSTPLEMALVASAIANGGSIMAPHVMAEIHDSNGGVVERYQDSVWKQAVSAGTAATMRAAMEGVVNGGTATGLALNGFVVGGKTGTAQLGTSPAKSHAWIIGYAGEAGKPPRVAVSVLVEGQAGASEQTGGKVAAPIAKRVLQVALAAPALSGSSTAPGHG